MILTSTELSPSQKAVIEEIVGRKIAENEAVSVRVYPPVESKTPKQQAAAENLRRFLESAERPRPGVTEEEYEAALLEALRSERPNYTPIS
jgi:hypothetical protein